MTINLKEALARLRAEKGNISVDGLRALIAQIDVVSTGSPTVLFSGNFSASAEFLSLVDDIHRSGADIRSVRSTAIAAFLDVRNNTDLTEVLTRLFGDSPLVEGSASYQFLGGQTGPNGRIANGIWDEISRRFARATSGDVRVLTSVDAVDGVFAKTELPELLKNPNVTTIEGIPRKQLLAMKERLGDAGLEGVRHFVALVSRANLSISGIAPGNVVNYLSDHLENLDDLVSDPKKAGVVSDAMGRFVDDLSKLSPEARVAAQGIVDDLKLQVNISGANGQLRSFDRLGRAVSWLDIALAVGKATQANSPEEASDIIVDWAVENVEGSIGSLIGSTAARVALGMLTVAGGPVATGLVLAASLVGGFYATGAFEKLKALLNDADEVDRRDILERLRKLHFGNDTTVTIDTIPTTGSDFIPIDPKFSPAAMALTAKNSLYWRYAVVEMNPFVVPDAPYEELHNANGELDLYDEQHPNGLTDAFLIARAEALHTVLRMRANGESVTGGDVFPGGYDIHFAEASDANGDDVDLHYLSDYKDQRLFGGDDDDVVRGAFGTDMLFGGRGDDILDGGSGADRLEGGAGDDSYRAGAGDTIFDADGIGSVLFDNKLLDGGRRTTGDTAYMDAGGEHRFVLNEGTLTVTRASDSATLTIEKFESGDLGIMLTEQAPVPDPVRGQVVGTSASEYLYGTHEDWSDPVQAFNFDDHIIGGAGRDWIYAWEKPIQDVEGISRDSIAYEGVAPDRDVVEGGVGQDVIYGGAGDDTLFATTLTDSDAVRYGAGDTAYAGPSGDSADLVDGGYGDDEIFGSAMLDGLFGGDGNDLIYGGGGDDQIHGDMQVIWIDPAVPRTSVDWSYRWITLDPASGDVTTYFPYRYQHTGDDRIYAGDGDDTVFGEAGDDVIFGEQGDDRLSGDASIGPGNPFADPLPAAYHGNDTLYGGAGNDGLIGNGGDDRLFGGNGDDVLDGDFRLLLDGDLPYHGDDMLDGGNGDDELTGGGGSDSLFGGDGDDELYGDLDGMDPAYHGDDRLWGDAGDDILLGQGGNDYLSGGAGDDVLFGDDADAFAVSGDDVLLGGDGDDQLSGGLGNDELLGGDGYDALWGDDGDDLLDGGRGIDLLAGGSGADTYRLALGDSTSAGGSIETIVDTAGDGNRIVFESGVDIDAIVLSAADDGDLIVHYGDGDAVYVDGGLTGTIDSFVVGDGLDVPYVDFIAEHLPDARYLTGGEADELVFGSSAGEALFGNDGMDRLFGGEGADYLFGGNADDTLVGGIGDDILFGGPGSDSYRVGAGQGDDFVYDFAGFDQIWLADALPGDVQYSVQGTDLIIEHADGSARVWFWQNGFSGVVRFADDSVVAIADVFDPPAQLGRRLTSIDACGSDVLGSAGDDVFSVDADGLVLRGGAGADTYLLNDRQRDVVIDDTEGGTTLVIDGDYRADVYLNRVGNDLQLDVGGATVAVIVDGVDHAPVRLMTAAGAKLSGAGLEALINVGPTSGMRLAPAPVVQDVAFEWRLPDDAFTDGDDGSLVLSAVLRDGDELPAWLDFDPATGTFSGIADNDDVGQWDLIVTATDRGGLSAESHVRLRVANVNDAPTVLFAPGEQIADTGYAYRIALADRVFADIDAGDVLTFAVASRDGATVPAWLQLDPAAGVLTGTPAGTDIGQLALIVTATDQAGASASVDLDIVVESAIAKTILRSTDLDNVDRLQIFSLTAAGDIDGDGFADVLVKTATQGGAATHVFDSDRRSIESAVYLYFGQPGGWSATPARVAEVAADIPFPTVAFGNYVNAADDGFFDITLRVLGDVDGDGYDDIGYLCEEGGQWSVRIRYGEASGWTGYADDVPGGQLTTILLDAAASGDTPDWQPLVRLGALDWDGEGQTELLFADDLGDVNLISDIGRWKGETVTASELVSVAATRIVNGTDVQSSLGIAAVQAVGDIDGDGRDDLFVSSRHRVSEPAWNDPDVTVEAVRLVHRVVYGGTGMDATIDLDRLAYGDAVEIQRDGYALQAGQRGMGILDVGDVNGDGYDDFAVDSPDDGIAIVFGGVDLGAVVDIAALDGHDGFTVTGLPDTEYRTDGYEIEHGDINADGFSDLVIGSVARPVVGPDWNEPSEWGLAWVVFGKGEPFEPTLDLWSMSAEEGFRLLAPYPEPVSETLLSGPWDAGFPYEGAEQLAIGDVDGDGIQDLIKAAVDGGVTELQTLYGRAFGALDALHGGDQPDSIVLRNGGVVYAKGGDDLIEVEPAEAPSAIFAGAGDDVVTIRLDRFSPNQADTVAGISVSGGAGNDRVVLSIPEGASGVRLPDAGVILQGGQGADSYVVTGNGFGGGSVHINDRSSAGGGNSLVMGGGYSGGAVRLSYGSLVLTFPDDGLAVHLENFDRWNVLGGPRDIDSFTFGDGIVLTYEELVARGFDVAGTVADDRLEGSSVSDRLYGEGGDDTLITGAGDDTLSGGAGADVLDGGVGDDLFLFAAGDGSDTLTDVGGEDVVRFAHGIESTMLAARRDGQDMCIAYGMGDELRIQGWYDHPEQIVEWFEFSDGSYLSSAALETRALRAENLVVGASSTERLQGTEGRDIILGMGGDDMLVGLAGDDDFLLAGNAGSVTIRGGEGYDRVLGGVGDDQIAITNLDYGAMDIEEIDGGEGLNRIQGSPGADFFNFYSVSLRNIDSIRMGAGNDVILGSPGDDTIAGEAGDDSLYGGDGNDTFLTGPGSGYDWISGGSGFDRILANEGNSVVGLSSYFGPWNGVEEIDGGANAAMIRGRPGQSYFDFSGTRLTNISGIHGGMHNDRIIASTGDDVIVGGRGDDELHGGAGDDLYRIGALDGRDRIDDSGGIDAICFDADPHDRLWFARSADDLVISVLDTTDQVTVEGWYRDPDRHVERIQTADSLAIDGTAVERLVAAMAVFAMPSSSGSVYFSEVQEQLAPTLAAVWQAA